ncbi:MAG: methylated-DNA--[protein]-cysteine S-methyltransferase [Acetatifactor sp.]|nr:methylated-DNA--[protein]-cysteine S-methyltransferase [Acetatifactor sp.]
MLYRRIYHSPLGEMTMVSDGKALTALSFQGQKYAETAANDEETKADDAQEPSGAGEGTEENGARAVFDRTAEWLDIYFAGSNPDFMPPLAAKGTPFQETVWEILRKIPYGKTISYGEIARQIAEERGVRRMSAQAVGGAVGRNPVAIIVPCHRVIGSDGSLTGYAGGLDRKEELLKLEKWL